MKTILTVDIGLSTGWALSNKDGITSGMKDFHLKKRGKLTLHRCTSFMGFALWVGDMLSDNNVTEVHYESVVSHKGSRAAHVYGAFECLLEIECFSRRIPVTGVGVTTIKQFATGNCHAKKPEMIEAAQKFFPDIQDDNEADAFHIMRYVLYGSIDNVKKTKKA